MAIWRAGLNAARSDLLVRRWARVEGQRLLVGERAFDLAAARRLAVVGGGKAGAGMAAGWEAALGPDLLAQKQVAGWLNVPADCVRPLERVHLHAARPAGVNEPTEEGAAGVDAMLRLAASLDDRDLCFCLLSGGGSALMPAPAAGVSLADKLLVTRRLSAAGANIRQLNTVRKQLSRFKGGGLARACGAKTLITLIISDVIGDPLDIIASGPTTPDPATADDALRVLEQFGARAAGVPQSVFDALEQARRAPPPAPPRCEVLNLVIGNNATAVDAAAAEAARRGYAVDARRAERLEGAAEEVGRDLARQAAAWANTRGRRCLVGGGEPTVALVEASRRGKGGRNQQLALAALRELAAGWLQGSAPNQVLLSAGTDGEDGPTDAAGAWIDPALAARARGLGLNIDDHLARNDAYRFFEPLGGLIVTGPTHTNVCDLRVLVSDT